MIKFTVLTVYYVQFTMGISNKVYTSYSVLSLVYSENTEQSVQFLQCTKFSLQWGYRTK